MNPRSWSLLLVACALLWALSLFLGGPQPKPSEVDADPQGVTFATTPAADVARSDSPRVPRSRTMNDKSIPPELGTKNLAAVRERYAQMRQQQELRNQQRFALVSERWESDFLKRDKVWATPREHVLRGALERDGVGARLRSVQCGSALCRIEVQAPPGEDVPALGRAEHFTREVGVQTVTAIHGEGADRVLTLFVARDGARLDALSAPRAEELPSPSEPRTRKRTPAVSATP